MKKIIEIFFCIIICITLTSCVFEPLPGEELIESARADYVSLTSGVLTVKNADNGVIEQSFTFLIDKNDVMKYSFLYKKGDNIDKEFFDGEKYVKLQDGEKTILEKGDKGFPKYTSKNRYPNASEEMLIYLPKAIENTDMTVSGKGTKIIHTYKASSLKTKSSDSKITSFVVTYSFDKQSNLIDITEESVVLKDGVETVNTYVIAITDKNSVTSIENPIK